MRDKPTSLTYVVLAFVCLWSSLAWPLGAFASGTESAEEDTVPGETPEQRIERLKRELLAAEEAAQAERDAAEKKRDHPKKNAIPTEALVIVSGAGGGGGSGFIAKLKGRPFFITNIHVLAASRGASFGTLGGEDVVLHDVAFLSKDRDLAIVPVSWSGEVFEVSSSLKLDKVALGDAVTVMGNSDGAGVVTELSGRIEGMGPDEIEVSAKFVPGNSGSPIFHDDLGTVIGLVSHVRDYSDRDTWTEDSELSAVRRFGYRLDGEIEWQRMSLNDLFEQGELFGRFEDRTQVLAHTVHMLTKERTIMTGYGSHDSLGYLFDRFEDGFSWERGTSSASNVLKLERFKNSVQNELMADRETTLRKLTVEFYKKRFDQIDGTRTFYYEELKDFRL